MEKNKKAGPVKQDKNLTGKWVYFDKHGKPNEIKINKKDDSHNKFGKDQ